MLAIVAALLTNAAQAEVAERDTEHIFGFTEGADIGAKGEKEIESTFTGRFGKPGHYAAIENETAFRHGLTDNFRASVGILSSTHSIAGVPGLDDRNAATLSYAVTQTAFVGFEVRHLTTNDGGFFFRPCAVCRPQPVHAGHRNVRPQDRMDDPDPDESTHALDLVNFERHQVRVLLVKNLQP